MIVKTYCARMDHGGCGLLVHLEDGKITRIEGDPDSPLSHGYLCAKGLAQLERINHPDRLQYPMKRLGKRGEGQWTRISWEVALNTISEKVRETIARDGPKAIALAQGTPKGLELFLMLRLANLLNIPNVSTPGHICHMPRETASNYVMRLKAYRLCFLSGREKLGKPSSVSRKRQLAALIGRNLPG